jgi:hypothetical protein
MTTPSSSDIQTLIKRRNIITVFLIINSIICLGIAFWGITQKVEAEKQKASAMQYKTLYESLLKKQ